jgi:hypothetical protein
MLRKISILTHSGYARCHIEPERVFLPSDNIIGLLGINFTPIWIERDIHFNPPENDYIKEAVLNSLRLTLAKGGFKGHVQLYLYEDTGVGAAEV